MQRKPFLIALVIPFLFFLTVLPKNYVLGDSLQPDDYYYFQGEKVPLKVKTNEIIFSFTPGTTDLERELTGYSSVKQVEKVSAQGAEFDIWRVVYQNNETELHNFVGSLPGFTFTSSTYQPGGDSLTYFFPIGVNVKPKNGVIESDVVPLFTQLGLCSPAESIDDVLGNFWTLTACDPEIDFLFASNRLFETGLFQYATPNFMHISVTPFDQIEESNPSSEEKALPFPWHLENIKAQEAQAFYDGHHSGSKPVVAVIDTGVQLDHPELAGILLPGFDATVSSGEGFKGGPTICYDNWGIRFPSDENDHGTEVAGVIASSTIGVAGNRVSIIPIRVMSYLCVSPQTKVYTSGDLSRSIIWARLNGATVINISLGSIKNGALAEEDEIAQAIQNVSNNNVLVIASAGNDGRGDVHFPASEENVVAVGGTDSEFYRYRIDDVCGQTKGENNNACGSNYGYALDLSAPYSDIQTIRPVTKYTVVGGTSFSSPQVAAVAAMMKGINPGLTNSQIKDILYGTAQKAANYVFDANGWNINVGHGVVDAYESVRVAANVSQPTVSFRALLERTASNANSASVAIAVFDRKVQTDGTYRIRFSTTTSTNSTGYSPQLPIPLTSAGQYTLCVKPKNYTFRCQDITLVQGQNTFVDFTSNGAVFYGGDMFGGTNTGDGQDGIITSSDIELFRAKYSGCFHSSSTDCLTIDWLHDGQINTGDWTVANINFSNRQGSTPVGKEKAYFSRWQPFKTTSSPGSLEESSAAVTGKAIVKLYNTAGNLTVGQAVGVNVYVDLRQLPVGAGSMNLVITYDPGVWTVTDSDPATPGIQVATLPGPFSSSTPGLVDTSKGEIVFGALIGSGGTSGTLGEGILAVLPMVATKGVGHTYIRAEWQTEDSTLSSVAQFQNGGNVIGEVTNYYTNIGGIARQVPGISFILPNANYINSSLIPITVLANDIPYNQVEGVELYLKKTPPTLFGIDNIKEDGWNFTFDSSSLIDQIINLCAYSYYQGAVSDLTCSQNITLDRTPPQFSSLESTDNGLNWNTTITTTIAAVDNLSGVKQIEFYVNSATDGTDSGSWIKKGVITGSNGSVTWNTTGLLQGQHKLAVAIEDNAGNWDRSSSVDLPLQVSIKTISSLNPSKITAGSDGLTLSVNGISFEPGYLVLWNGVSRPTEYISSTQLRATISPVDVKNPGIINIQVVNRSTNELSNSLEFTINPNIVPSLIFPSGGATIKGTPEYSWTAPIDAVAFIIEIDDDTDFKSPFFTSAEIASKSFTPPLQPEGIYYWHVKARNEGNYWSTWSTRRKVIIEPAIPSAPLLSLPKAGTFTKDNTPTFSWKAAGYSVKYQIQISKTNTFSQSIVLDKTLVPGKLTHTTSSLEDSKYFWRVRGINSLGEFGLWSSVRNFTVDTINPTAPKLTSPANDSTVSYIPNYKWQAVTGAKSYQFTYAINSTFTNGVFSSPWVTVLQYKPSVQTNGFYWWRVRAKDAAGNIGPWSTFRTISLE